MHEQIQLFLDVVEKHIEGTAIKYFDRYVETLNEALVGREGVPPDQPMLKPEFHDLVRAIILGGQMEDPAEAENKLAYKIASNQIGFAVQDYLKSTE